MEKTQARLSSQTKPYYIHTQAPSLALHVKTGSQRQICHINVTRMQGRIKVRATRAPAPGANLYRLAPGAGVLRRHWTNRNYGANTIIRKVIGPLILNLGSRWRKVVSLTLRPLDPSKERPWYHWIGGWVGRRTGVNGLEKRIVHCVCRD
jgi:hypothetical protein